MDPKKPPRFEVHNTEQFSTALTILRRGLGKKQGAVLQSLAKAILQIESDNWAASRRPEPYGTYGDSFSLEFLPGYLLVYRRETERDERKQPVVVHCYRKNIFRTQS